MTDIIKALNNNPEKIILAVYDVPVSHLFSQEELEKIDDPIEQMVIEYMIFSNMNTRKFDILLDFGFGSYISAINKKHIVLKEKVIKKITFKELFQHDYPIFSMNNSRQIVIKFPTEEARTKYIEAHNMLISTISEIDIT